MIDGWERDEINSLHRRVEQLEKVVAELDARTQGSIHLGPQPWEPDLKAVDEMVERIRKET